MTASVTLWTVPVASTSPNAPYYYRAKILGEGATVFNKILASITKRLQLDVALQRTDSTMVQVNLARMSKLELFSTTIKKFLGELRQAHPIIYGRLDQELRDRYLPAKENSWFASNKPSQYKEILLLAAKDVLGLIAQFKDHPSARQLPSFALLARLAEEQIVGGGEEIVVQANKDTKGTAMANPHDPDAHYNGHHKKVGFKADFTESCAKDKDTPNPKIVTQVSVHPANTSDKTTIPPLKSSRTKGSSPKPCSPTTGTTVMGISKAARNTEWTLCARPREPLLMDSGSWTLFAPRKTQSSPAPWGNNALKI